MQGESLFETECVDANIRSLITLLIYVELQTFLLAKTLEPSLLSSLRPGFIKIRLNLLIILMVIIN